MGITIPWAALFPGQPHSLGSLFPVAWFLVQSKRGESKPRVSKQASKDPCVYSLSGLDYGCDVPHSCLDCFTVMDNNLDP